MKTPLNPQLLDLVMRDNDFVIFLGSEPMKTPGGKEFSNINPRLLQHLIFEIAMNGFVCNDGVSAYSIFSEQKDNIESTGDVSLKYFQANLDNDYFIKLKIKGIKPEMPDNPDLLLDFYEKNRFVLNLSLGATANLQNLINEFLIEEGYKDIETLKTASENLFNFLKNLYLDLSDDKKSAFNVIQKCHNSGVILPLMLVTNAISPSEYSITYFNIKLNEYISGDLKPEIIFNKIHKEANVVSEYIFYSNFIEQIGSKAKNLIRGGENLNTEFKSTLRWNLKTQKKDTAIEHASLKTISAFLNSSGGHLLIGVRDDRTIQGIEADKFDSDDKFLLHLWQLIGECIGDDMSSYIKTNIEKVEGKSICIVQCLRSPSPVFLKQKGYSEEFYIRVGPGSTNLTISDAMKYIADRFKS